MNRQERRELDKKLRRKGKTKQEAQDIVRIMDNADAIRANGSGEASPPQFLPEGTKVRLNIEKIHARMNYDRMSDTYKEFVDASEGSVFTVLTQRNNVICLAEDTRWLFWSGDLDIVGSDEVPCINSTLNLNKTSEDGRK